MSYKTTDMNRPHEKGMQKGILYAAHNDRQRRYKQEVKAYIRKRYNNLDELPSTTRKDIAEKKNLSVQTINEYIKEIIQERESLKLHARKNGPVPEVLFTPQLNQYATIIFPKVKELGLDLRTYEAKHIAQGVLSLRLDFKLAVKGKDAIELYFTDINSGARYKFTQWKHNGKYEPVNGYIDFEQPYLNGELFSITVSINTHNYPFIDQACYL